MLKEGYQKLKSTLGLAWQLAKANFKLRNEGSYLGIFWYLLSPLIYFLVIMAVFSQNIGSDIENYPLYVLLGLIMFNFFSGTTSRATKIIIENAGFVKSMRVNYFALILSTILQFIASHLFEIIIFAGLLIYYNLPLINLLYYPLIFLIFIIFTTGICLIISAIGVYISDLDNLWHILLSILWILTPIFYSIERVKSISSILVLNPIAHFLNITRDIILYSKTPEWYYLTLMILISLLTFLIGFFLLNKFKSNFAERL